MSAARERAGRALWRTIPFLEGQQWEDVDWESKELFREESDIAHRASLDESDAALVEAAAKALRTIGPAYDHKTKAILVIVAIREHITGEGA